MSTYSAYFSLLLFNKVAPKPQKGMKSEIVLKLENNLALLYGKEAINTTENLCNLIKKWKGKIERKRKFWNQSDSILITYASPFETSEGDGISLLEKFLDNYVTNSISTIHILPFYPSTSDGGFSVVNFREVDTSHGNWKNIKSISENYRMAFDCVINHASKSSRYVKGHLNQSDEYSNFCIEKDPSFDSSNVTRPRTSDLFHSYDSSNGEIKLWTTFSEDQVDLNFSNPRVLIELMDVILFYSSMGASILRLDAIPYLWKESGTKCVHLKQTHAFIRIIRILLEEAAPHVLILSETNVPHHENLSYFGSDKDEAHIIYNFTLPPLILYALTHDDAEPLTRWASTLKTPSEKCTFLNITSTHDGIGMRPAEGILTKEQIESLVNKTLSHDGYVSYRSNPDGSKSPYELNITFFDAINNPNETELPIAIQARKFLISQSIAMTLTGIPAIYFQSLLGLRNSRGWHETKRDINRGQVNFYEIVEDLKDENSLKFQIFNGIKELLEKRKLECSFHPQSENTVLDLGKHIFAVWRCCNETNQMVIALHNLSNEPIVCTLPKELHNYNFTDLLEPNSSLSAPNILIPIYGIRWLKVSQ